MILNACAISRSNDKKLLNCVNFKDPGTLIFVAYEQAGDIPGGMDPCLKLNIASGGRYTVSSVRGLKICRTN
jgi:hypothetical protein